MTVQELIERALIAATVLDKGDALDPDELTDGLATFNELMFSLEVDGLRLGHSTQGATDTVLVDDGRLRTLRYMLAVDLAAENGTQAPQLVMAAASRGKRKWLADHTTPRDVIYPAELRNFRSNQRYARYDIEEGS